MTADSQFVTADYLRRSADRMASLKGLSYDRMAITPGDHVLDLGCGPGIDAVALAHRVGREGRVVAVDIDPTMLAEGERHATAQGVTQQVEFYRGSALELPLADNSVAASRAERLIQVLPPADAPWVLAELRRVTRPGGRVVLMDTDWGSGSVECDDNDLERRLMAFFARQMRPNGFAGRRLLRLAREAGLMEINVESMALLHHQLESTPIEWLADTARQAGEMSEQEHRVWLDSLRAREATGALFIQTNIVMVTGVVPEPQSLI